MAYRAGAELAWPRDQALRVLDLLNKKKYIIVGVETWIPTKPGPTPLINDWTPERAKKSDSFPQTAQNFVSAFKRDPAENGGVATIFCISALRPKN